MPQTPGIGYPPDSSTNLWRKASENFFEIAQQFGYSDFLEPNGLDNEVSSMRKSVTFTAYIGENMP